MENPTKYMFVEERPNGSTAIKFTLDEDEMDIYNLHVMCKRFAAALGYHSSSIDKVFGETWHEETTI